MKRFVIEMVACGALAACLAYAERAIGDGHVQQTPAHRLDEWLVDPYGRVDGALLRDGRAIFFAPAIGRELTARVRIGDPVRIDTIGGHLGLYDERDGTLVDLSTLPRGGGPVAMSPLEPFTARGNVSAFVLGSNGRMMALILDTGDQVRLPASMSVAAGKIHIGDMIIARGHGSVGPWGTGMLAYRIVNNRGEIVAGD